MGIESIKSYRNAVLDTKGKTAGGQVLRYDEANERITSYLTEVQTKEMKEERKSNDETIEKDKEYLEDLKADYRQHIKDAIRKEKFTVLNYDNMNDFVEEMVDEHVGFSILSKLFEDPEVTDIYVNSWDSIFYEKNGINHKLEKTFKNEKHFRTTLNRFLNESGKKMSGGEDKIVDFELYGDRGCAIDNSVSYKGTSLTLRKHSETHITLKQLLDQKVMNEDVSEFLGMAMEGERNMICGGVTGSGKTTTMRAQIEHYIGRTNKRVLVCEDTPELFLDYEHVLNLVTVKNSDPKLAVSLSEVIITALRQKPKYIIVGEVRGEEALAAVEGMETGHSTIMSMHGGKPWNVVNRLITKYMTAMDNIGIDVVERIIGSSLDYIYIQANIPNIGRRITGVTEVSYDYSKKQIVLKPIFEYNAHTDSWEFKNTMCPNKAALMVERGVDYNRIKPWLAKEDIVS